MIWPLLKRTHRGRLGAVHQHRSKWGDEAEERRCGRFRFAMGTAHGHKAFVSRGGACQHLPMRQCRGQALLGKKR
eukprot:CAMPEP_0174331862 /NCGR_PEP_ID=MMETSP0810-20121108/17834_1 /TAXON_ID=73025 ORGANISM="Eutreptiella gymnastica-like, Strain CCMP1594" /NCGR_SAMPLE_ID=MMETSP0810 /ASSEMBLY_ACC=CAM_ASM_000659 /LENGTH=74 /DNA_ID=CAMNT_0015447919 /DNA_START=174 /DNA_END=398 /DNA_ORIENTATION=+